MIEVILYGNDGLMEGEEGQEVELVRKSGQLMSLTIEQRTLSNHCPYLS